MEKVVSNSACLITLGRIDLLSLIPKCFRQIFIPTGVQEEIAFTMPWLTVTQVGDLNLANSLKIQLGKGEAEAIALAVEMQIPVILDDKKARKIAENLKIPVIGTLGILLQAKRLKLIPQIQPIITRLQQANFYVSPTLVAKVLQEANEDR